MRFVIWYEMKTILLLKVQLFNKKQINIYKNIIQLITIGNFVSSFPTIQTNYTKQIIYVALKYTKIDLYESHYSKNAFTFYK